MKLLLGAILLLAAALVVLGPTLGFNLRPEKLLGLITGASIALIKFLSSLLTKFLEGLT